MRNLKKVLVLVLSLAMMLSIMVVGAGAFTDSDKIDDAHQEAVEIATQLNIINGYPDGSFKPEGNITRAEMSKIICIALNGGQVPATAVKAEPSFKDIQGNWAEGFIEYCYAKGIVAGVGNDEFNPNGNVTGAEAAKMLLVALGYNADAEKYVGPDWDLYVNVQANQDGLYVDLLDIETKDPLTREHAAQMIWNALQAFTVEKTTNVDRTDGSINDTYAKTDVTLFWESYRGYQGKAQMIGFEYDKDAAEWTYYLQIDAATMGQQVGKNQIRGNVNGKFTSDKDYTALLGHDVQAIFNIDARNATYKANVGKVYGIFNDGSAEPVTACFGDVTLKAKNPDIIKVGDEPYRLQDGTTYDTLPVYEFRSGEDFRDYTVFTNGQTNGTITLGQIDAMGYYEAQKFTAVDEDNNGKVDFLITTPFSFVKVDSLNGTKVQLYGAFVDNVDPTVILNERASTKRWLSDQVSMYDGLAKGDWVKYTAAANTATDVDLLEKPDSVFSGTISKSDAPDVTVDGKDYTFVNEYFYTGKGTASAASKEGNELTDAMVINGYIFRVAGLKRATFDDFAIVTGADAGNGPTGTNPGGQATLLFANGTVETVKTTFDSTGMVGQLVDYYVQDGEYTLKQVNIPEEGPHGDYSMFGKIVAVNPISNSNSNIGNLQDKDGNWADINDNAVVFVKYFKDRTTQKIGYKVITGAQLKQNPVANFKADTVQNVIVVATKDAPKSTTNHAEFAYIDLTANNVIPSQDYYGYVMGTDTVNGYKTLDLWTVDGKRTLTYNDKNITVIDSQGNATSDPWNEVITSGMAIRYKTTNGNPDGNIDKILGYYDVDTAAMNSATGYGYQYTDLDAKTTFYANTIAITNLPDENDANQKFEFVQYPDLRDTVTPTVLAPDGKHYFDIDDADVLYVDIDEDEGYASGYDLDTAGHDNAGINWVSNAFIVYEPDGTVDLIVNFVDGQ